jgi:hypothetical protein
MKLGSANELGAAPAGPVAQPGWFVVTSNDEIAKLQSM